MTDLQSLYAGICAQPGRRHATPRSGGLASTRKAGSRNTSARRDSTHVQMVARNRVETVGELRNRWNSVTTKVAEQEQKGNCPGCST